MSESLPNCGSGGGDASFQGLRVASLFIIWTTSSFAATFPVVAQRSRLIHFPLAVFESVSFLCQFLFLTSSPQNSQIFWLWGHHRHCVHPPPRPRHQRTYLILSWTRMAALCSHTLRSKRRQILTGAYNVALRPGTRSPIVFLHIYD
jgi:hypothetical protein